MKEVQILSWCDGPHEAAPPAVQTITIQFDKNKARSIDLCERCVLSMITPVEQIMEKFGVEPQVEQQVSKSKDKGVHKAYRTCPECGFESASRSGLGIHLRRAHDTGFKDYKEFTNEG